MVTLAEIPGFALRVPAGSATFPADVDDHTVTVTAVHTDKIPMPPGEGMQPRFIISIGPPEVKFDPPAPITYPNVDGLKPGEQTHFYSFDHDLGTFVSIGTGTVSEDGATITSDKGFGIVKGGWHCAGQSNPSGSAAKASVAITSGNGKTVLVNQPVSLTAQGSPSPGSMRWSGGGSPGSGSGNAFTTTFTSIGNKNLSATWTCLSGASSTAIATVKVAEVVKDAVTGADFIGTDGGVDVFASAVGEGSVTIRLKTNPAGAVLDPGTVQWSGGEPGGDQLTRTVSVSSLNKPGINVLAQVGKNTFKYRVHVFEPPPPDAPLVKDISVRRDDAISPADFGVTDIGDAFKAKEEFGIYYNAGQWVFAFKKISYEVRWGINSLGRFDVTSGSMDPFPGLSIWTQSQRKAEAKKDLDPGASGVPKRNFYWSSALTKEHELYHVKEWIEDFYPPHIEDAEALIELERVQVTLSDIDPEMVLNREKAGFHSTVMDKTKDAKDMMDPAAEARAYGAGAAGYQALSDSIFP